MGSADTLANTPWTYPLGVLVLVIAGTNADEIELVKFPENPNSNWVNGCPQTEIGIISPTIIAQM